MSLIMAITFKRLRKRLSSFKASIVLLNLIKKRLRLHFKPYIKSVGSSKKP